MFTWKVPSSRWLPAVLLLSLVWGCEKGGKGPPDVQHLLDQGWQWFEADQLDSAYAAFGDAVLQDPQNPEAWLGLGWTSLRLYDPVYAHQSLLRTLALGGDSLDAWAGLAIADADPIPDPALYGVPLDSVLHLALGAATLVLERQPTYRFAHDPRVTADLLLLEKARVLCSLGRFAEALTLVQILDPNFDADVTTPEGRAALLQKIADLLNTYGWP